MIYKVKLTHGTRVWFRGGARAVIGGGASSVAAIVIDPSAFNINNIGGVRHILSLFIVSGFFSLMHYLQKSPLPDEQVIEENSQTLDADGNVVEQKNTQTVVKSTSGV